MIPLYIEKVNCNGFCVFLKKMARLIKMSTVRVIRQAVSSLHTFNYQLSKFLCSLLEPHLPSTYTVSDSVSFAHELTTIDVSNKYIVSFDVMSLFTNIPLNECIDLAISYITKGNTELKLSKDDLTKLFTIATAQTHFLFNDKVYDQMDGVAMGSPIAPVLANLFLGNYEKLWLNECKCLSVQFYRRYVDDTFCLFNNEHEALLFFEFLNSQHDNIKFTMEKETNNTLAFLMSSSIIKILLIL